MLTLCRHDEVSSSLALIGFTHWSHLEGVNCESLNVKNPVQSEVLARAAMKASLSKSVKKKLLASLTKEPNCFVLNRRKGRCAR